MTSPPVTIAIATIGERIRQLESWDFDPRIAYVVLWQSPDATIAFKAPSNVRLVKLLSEGVTSSRNAAIDLCETDWIWFMDDDVKIPGPVINKLLQILPEARLNEIFVCAVQFGDSGTVKSPSLARGQLRLLLGAGTVQIICSAERARSKRCSFPTNMGAGTPYPNCDEPIFLNRMITRAGCVLVPIPDVCIFHPEISSGTSYKTPGHLVSRAMLFRELFGFPLCIIASCLFYLRNRRKFSSSVRHLFRYERAL